MSAHPQTADAKARANQTANQVLNHPLVQQGAAIGHDYLVKLDKSLSQYPILNNLEAQTRVPKVYGVLGLGLSSIFLIFFNLFGLASPLSSLVGWVLPAYLSVKALESPGMTDDKQWLTYWVIFGFFNFIESAAIRPILYWFPFYFVTKTLFILWLMSPSFRGAETLYYNVVRKVFLAINNNASPSTTGRYSGSTGAVPGYAGSAGAIPGYTTTSATFEDPRSL